MRVSLARDATRATFARADAARATIDRATARRATRSSRGTLSTARGAIDAGTRARVGRGAGAREKKADVPDVVRETTHALAGGHAVRVETRTRANGTTTATLRAADDALLERCARGEVELHWATRAVDGDGSWAKAPRGLEARTYTRRAKGGRGDTEGPPRPQNRPRHSQEEGY